jgi:hypothetical protein
MEKSLIPKGVFLLRKEQAQARISPFLPQNQALKELFQRAGERCGLVPPSAHNLWTRLLARQGRLCQVFVFNEENLHATKNGRVDKRAQALTSGKLLHSFCGQHCAQGKAETGKCLIQQGIFTFAQFSLTLACPGLSKVPPIFCG